MGPESSEGALLQLLVENATERVLLAAPFMKVQALRRCLEGATSGLHVDVFTRWRPEEVAAGVSDLAVWDLVREMPNARLFLSHRLHAKVYRTESRCVVGSANVTGSALGWVMPSNLELLIECGVDEPRVLAFERALRASAVEVDDELHSRMLALVARYELEAPVCAVAEDVAAWGVTAERGVTPPTALSWVPALRQPDDLYVAYIGDYDLLSTQARIAARSDLDVLSLPKGLKRGAFNDAVEIALAQMPAVAVVDSLVATPQRFGAVVDELQHTLGLGHEESVASWQALMRWLLFFAPDRYERRVDRHTEMFARRA